MFDCALFDIDGVLVDIRKSYNEAIKKTVEFVLGRADVFFADARVFCQLPVKIAELVQRVFAQVRAICSLGRDFRNKLAVKCKILV